MSASSVPPRPLLTLLRQLSVGLSSYRLFPGDLTQPAFVAATERVANAASEALAQGAVTVEVHGTSFRSAGAELPDDETRGRFASALFERSAERFELRSVPDAHDLTVLYEALNATPREVAAAGGVGAMLQTEGVTAIVVEGVAPEALEAEYAASLAPGREMSSEQQAIWDQLQDAAGYASGLLIDRRGADPTDRAEAVFGRFGTLLAVLPDWVTTAPDLYGKLHEIVEYLEPSVRRAFFTIAIARAENDRLSQGFLGTMPNGHLARAIVEAGTGGGHPVEMAARLVSTGVRRDDIVDLTAALSSGADDAGTIVAGLGDRVQAAIGSTPDGVADTMSDLLARSLGPDDGSDMLAIREMYPTTLGDRQTLALAALRDYLAAERDIVRLGHVLETWAGAARRSIRDGDLQELTRLLDVVDETRGEADTPRAVLIDAERAKLLDEQSLGSIIARVKDGGSEAALPYLAPFGAAAIRRLLDALADEEDQKIRGRLVTLIADTAGEHDGIIAERLDDERWYVARNAATILGRLGAGRSDAGHILAHLVKASTNRDATVRKEAIRGIAACGGADGVQFLRRAVTDEDEGVRIAALQSLSAIRAPSAAAALADAVRTLTDPHERRRALDELARHPAADEHLRTLASRTSRPRLPLRLRRAAATLARERAAVSR